MATSTKVKFSLGTLKAKALESIDFKIAQQEAKVAAFDDDESFARRIEEWRARQEEKISHLFAQLGEGGIDNHRLSKFTLDPIPEIDKWERARETDRLAGLKSKRVDIIAKSESVVGDENGNISLTKTQLTEFFGL